MRTLQALFSAKTWRVLLNRVWLTHSPGYLLVGGYTGPGASDRQAADRDVSRPSETDPVRELHRGSVYTRASAGPGLHPQDRGIQPSDPVSAAAVRL